VGDLLRTNLAAAVSKKGLQFYPSVLGFGVLSAGTLLFISEGSLSSIQPRGDAPLMFGVGGLAIAVVLLFGGWLKPLPSGLHINLNIAGLIGTALVMACSLLELYPPGELGLLPQTEMVLAGASVAFVTASWVLILRAMSLRTVLLNCSLALLIHAAVYGLAQTSDFAGVTILRASCLLIGAICAFLTFGSIPKVQTDHQRESGPTATLLLKQMVFSVPIIGAVVSYITLGASSFDAGFRLDAPIIVCSIAGITLLVLSLVCSVRSLGKMNERSLAYIVFRIVLPSLALFALFIRAVPFDLVSNVLFTYYMLYFSQILSILAWVYLAYLVRDVSRSVAFYCGLLQVVVSASLVLGFAARSAGELWALGFMGIGTAGFLVFSAFYFGRSCILLLQSAESDNEHPLRAQSLEANCEAIAEKYGLSPRETEVLVELAYGHASSYIARVLVVSNNTARTHMKNIYKKLSINSREELIELVRKSG
jgi:DNA-binding CsgD family transcriptional regulator